jgi:hypothetical protein
LSVTAIGHRDGDVLNYADGLQVEPGDIVLVDGTDRGRVVASIDTDKHLQGHDGWAYLREGIMVDTDFAGLVHYTVHTVSTFALLERKVASS